MANQEKNCYIVIDGKKLGPASEADIQKLYDHKKITGDTKFARAGDTEWITVSAAGILTPPLPVEDDGLPPLPLEDKPLQNNEVKANEVKTNEAQAVKAPTNKSKLRFIAAGLGVAVVASVFIIIGIFSNTNNTPTALANNEVGAAEQVNNTTNESASGDSVAITTDLASEDFTTAQDYALSAELLELQTEILGQWHVYDASFSDYFVGGELINFFADGTGHESAGGILHFTWGLEEAPEYASNRLTWVDDWRNFSVFPHVMDDKLYLHFEAGPPLIFSRNARITEAILTQDETEQETQYSELDIEQLRTAAEQGQVNAQLELGRRYSRGIGVSTNNDLAAQWYRRAAEQGHATAQGRLALMYYEGRGVPQNDSLAVQWLNRAAEQNHMSSQNNLALMYVEGRGAPQNDNLAVQWFRRAAEQGHAAAQANLGFMYEYGRGVPRDFSTAEHWYRLAAEQGYERGQSNLDGLLNRILPTLTGQNTRLQALDVVSWLIEFIEAAMWHEDAVIAADSYERVVFLFRNQPNLMNILRGEGGLLNRSLWPFNWAYYLYEFEEWEDNIAAISLLTLKEYGDGRIMAFEHLFAIRINSVEHYYIDNYRLVSLPDWRNISVFDDLYYILTGN